MNSPRKRIVRRQAANAISSEWKFNKLRQSDESTPISYLSPKKRNYIGELPSAIMNSAESKLVSIAESNLEMKDIIEMLKVQNQSFREELSLFKSSGANFFQKTQEGKEKSVDFGFSSSTSKVFGLKNVNLPLNNTIFEQSCEAKCQSKISQNPQKPMFQDLGQIFKQSNISLPLNSELRQTKISHEQSVQFNSQIKPIELDYSLACQSRFVDQRQPTSSLKSKLKQIQRPTDKEKQYLKQKVEEFSQNLQEAYKTIDRLQYDLDAANVNLQVSQHKLNVKEMLISKFRERERSQILNDICNGTLTISARKSEIFDSSSEGKWLTQSITCSSFHQRALSSDSSNLGYLRTNSNFFEEGNRRKKDGLKIDSKLSVSSIQSNWRQLCKKGYKNSIGSNIGNLGQLNQSLELREGSQRQAI